MAERERLGPGGWLLVVRMGVWRVALPVLRRRVALERLVRFAAAPRDRPRDPARERLIARVGGRLWRDAPGPCLERSLAVYRQLGLAGASPRVTAGMTNDAGALVGHVWVTLDGVAILEQADPAAEFRALVVFGPDGRRLGPAVE